MYSFFQYSGRPGFPVFICIYLRRPIIYFYLSLSGLYRIPNPFLTKAVFSLHGIIWTSLLPSSYNAQAAKLAALTQAYEAMRNWSTNIYTDARYVFEICHATGALWKQWGVLTSAGHPIAHATLVSKLLLAIQLAIIQCRAHQKDNSQITKGNQYADLTAK